MARLPAWLDAHRALLAFAFLVCYVASLAALYVVMHGPLGEKHSSTDSLPFEGEAPESEEPDAQNS